MEKLYVSNQVHVFPADHDFAPGDDRFFMDSPFMFATRGASWTDKPLLELLLAASASFRPETKKKIVASGMLTPTLQALLRSSVRGAGDPLSPGANPVAFSAKSIDAGKLAAAAHGMAPDAIPPLASVSFFETRPPGGRIPQPLRDYPDPQPEIFVSTHFASCFVLRAPDGVRTFELRASAMTDSLGTQDSGAEFAWRVLRGDASAAKIETEPGSRGARARLVIDRRKLDSRVDVACFAKTRASGWGAPSFISFLPVPQEERTYREDGRISSIDYRNPRKRPCSPSIALPRSWRDLYLYGADGTL